MLFLETPRLILREMTEADAPALFTVLGDEETMRWYPRPFTLAETEARIRRYMSLYASGAGLLGVVSKDTEELIGDCGITWQEVEGIMEPELGYHLRRDCWNRGFTTEAARAVRDHAFTTPDFDYLISLIRPGNTASRRVAEKNGFTLDRVVLWRELEHCVYRVGKGA